MLPSRKRSAARASGFATAKPSPGSSGRRSRGRPSRSSPRRSARDPMTGGFDAHRHNRDPRRRRPVQSPGARPNTLRHSGLLSGPCQIPRSRRTPPRSTPTYSCLFCQNCRSRMQNAEQPVKSAGISLQPDFGPRHARLRTVTGWIQSPVHGCRRMVVVLAFLGQINGFDCIRLLRQQLAFIRFRTAELRESRPAAYLCKH